MAYAGILIASDNLFGDYRMSYSLAMIHHFFRDSRSTLLMCGRRGACRHQTLGKFFSAAEQMLLARIAVALTKELNRRYGTLQFQDRRLNRL
jgi:hypothetical protein